VAIYKKALKLDERERKHDLRFIRNALLTGQNRVLAVSSSLEFRQIAIGLLLLQEMV